MVDDSQDPELAEENAYLGWLGSFIESFATFESVVLIYLQSEAKIERELVLAFCAGANLDQKKDIIRRIWQFRQPLPALRKEIEDVFWHSKKIAEARNLMLHYGSFVRDGQRFTTDVERVIEREKAKRHPISPEIVLQMRLDIIKCSYHLLSLANQDYRPLEVRQGLFTAIRRAWLYTPPPDRPPKSHTPTRRDRKQKRGRPGPPKPSQ